VSSYNLLNIPNREHYAAAAKLLGASADVIDAIRRAP
jgi:hypothetical protein